MQENQNDKKIFWQNHMEKWKDSGLSQTAYCKQEHLTYHNFNSWKQKLVSDKESKFVEIKSGHSRVKMRDENNYGYEIEIGQIKLRFKETVNPEQLQLVINILRQ